MRIFLFLLTFTLPAVLSAQKNIGGIKGVIYDSLNDYALQSASISVFKNADSSVVDFQLSNTSGEFDIKNLPVKTPLYFIISHTGYQSLVKSFLLDSTVLVMDFRKISLRPKADNELEEVTIRAVQPIRMNGDTLEINPDAFRLDSNAVVEDMLMRTPGLTVWSDGTITMNGRKIDKVYVGGKPFFGGSTQTATQNLPKNAIEKIQIYQEKDYNKVQAMDERADSLYTMNIKLKEDKNKGIFGKVGAGYGTDDRYTGDGVIQAYNKRTQLGIAAGINNINKEEGTGENAFLENTFKSNFRMFFAGRGGAANGITRRTYANLKMQHSFSDADNSQFYNRLSTDYGYLNLLTNVNSATTNIQNVIRDNKTYKVTNTGENIGINSSTGNNAKFLYENRKQFGNFVNITATYNNQFSNNQSTSQTEASQDNLVTSQSLNTHKSTSTNDNFNLFGFIRSNDAGQLKDPRENFMVFFNAGHNKGNSNSHTVSNFTSYIDTISSDKIDRKYLNNNTGYYASLNFQYEGFKNLIFGIYNFFNIDMALLNEISINRDERNTAVADLNPDNNQYYQNDLLTNDNMLTNFSYKPGLSLRKSINKSVWEKYSYWFSAGLELKQQFLSQKNESSFLIRNIERHFSSFTPSLNANYGFTKNNAYRINAYMWSNIQLTPPSIDQLYPIVDSTNRYSIMVGNPDLKAPTARYLNSNIELSRAKMNTKSNYSASLGISVNHISDAISDNVVYDGTNRSVRYLLNVKNQHTISGNFNARFSTNLNKTNSLSFNYRSNLSANKRPGYINHIPSVSRNNSLSNNLSATYSLLDKFNISIGETIGTNTSEQSGSNPTASVIRNFSTEGNINYFITKTLSFNTSLNHQKNIAANGNAIQAGIWNITTTYRFMQQKAELKFSAFDLLKQNKNIVNFVRENSASTTISNGLQQYFMLTFSYYPRKFGGKTGNPTPRGGVIIVK